ncbi:hypothetical protein [Glycomyces xiaoerkulensis]|uniref:hypothetical protein n=1 Tax=Glycomyces xiaoerkulensis TaxID=2038139 RepID=UPI000C2601C4|nr:hypothetical protein [Glycomyces xiaoerkulensis]
MGRIGGNRTGGWPLGAWFALVGVSAGTVAMFAAVAWAFTDATGLYEGSEAAGPPGWAVEDPMVIDAESAPSPTPDSPTGRAPGGGAGEPRVEPLGGERTGEPPESDPATGHGPSEEPAAPTAPTEEASSSSPADGPVEEEPHPVPPEHGKCEPTGQPLPSAPAEPTDGSNKDSDPKLILEHMTVGPVSPLE